MSHWTTLKSQIKDVDALRAACSELNLTLLANATARGYGNNREKADLVIRLPGPYDIACIKQADGSFNLQTDWWQGHVAKAVGSNYGKLLQLYGIHKTTAEARRKGWTVQRQTGKNGSIKLQITGVTL